jgi:hypothetical protein
MVAWLALSFLSASALSVDFFSVHSDKPLSAAEYGTAPGLRLLQGAETKTFFRPLFERLETRRMDDLPPGCDVKGAVYVVYDVASWLTDLTKQSPRDDALLRMLSTLGVGDATLLSLCVKPKGNTLEINAFLALKRYSGTFAALSDNDVSADTAMGSHYLSGGVHMDGRQLWSALKALDRAVAGTRGSRIEGILQGAGTVLGANIEQALIDPLTGRASFGMIVDPKSKRSARVIDLDASDTQKAAALAGVLEETMPRADFSDRAKKRQANEWGFIGGLPGVGTFGGAIFMKLFDKRMIYSDAAFGLEPAASKLAEKLPLGVATVTIDLARYRGLYERVGRPADTKELFTDLRLSSFVEMGRAPHPKALFAGLNRLTLVLVKEDAGLRVVGTLR